MPTLQQGESGRSPPSSTYSDTRHPPPRPAGPKSKIFSVIDQKLQFTYP